MRTAEKDNNFAAALSAGGQLNSFSIVSISSSSDPSYMVIGMVREELWQLPKVLGRVEKHVSNMVIKKTLILYIFMLISH